jgi:phosphatidylserine decarboxylase
MTKQHPLVVIDRISRLPVEEEVWGDWGLRLLYGESIASKTIGRFLLHTLFRWPVLSWAVGKYYDTAYSRRLIVPFCKRFHINTSEQILPLDQFTSFNDFFTRRLHPECRKQDLDPRTITAPADGRYTIIPILDPGQAIPVKTQYLCLDKLLGCKILAARFYGGTGVICRLCPTDYHRFYFPVGGKASNTSWIHGSLFSVSPIATSPFPWIFWTNRRAITLIETEHAATIAYIEVGATNCGSIVQNFIPNSWIKKGQEKGFFRLGGSAIILLFEPNQVRISDDLVDLSSSGNEVLCRVGQPLATIVSQ